MSLPRIPNWKQPGPRVRLTSEVVEAFDQYRREKPAWGAFHVVLADGNCHDCFCDVDWLVERGAPHGLAVLLHRMSPTQRGRLARIV